MGMLDDIRGGAQGYLLDSEALLKRLLKQLAQMTGGSPDATQAAGGGMPEMTQEAFQAGLPKSLMLPGRDAVQSLMPDEAGLAAASLTPALAPVAAGIGLAKSVQEGDTTGALLQSAGLGRVAAARNLLGRADPSKLQSESPSGGIPQGAAIPNDGRQFFKGPTAMIDAVKFLDSVGGKSAGASMSRIGDGFLVLPPPPAVPGPVAPAVPGGNGQLPVPLDQAVSGNAQRWRDLGDHYRAPGAPPADWNGLSDPEGRPVFARNVAGQQTQGGPDVPLSMDQERGVAQRFARVEDVAPSLIDGNNGRVRMPMQPEPDANGLPPQRLEMNRDLGLFDPEQYNRTFRHEGGHVIDDIVRKVLREPIPEKLIPEFEAASAKMRPQQWGTPEEINSNFPNHTLSEVKDYRSRHDELMADALRFYKEDPAGFKETAPGAAAYVRDKVNPDRRINSILQFNQLAPLMLSGGAGGSLLLGDKDRR